MNHASYAANAELWKLSGASPSSRPVLWRTFWSIFAADWLRIASLVLVCADLAPVRLAAQSQPTNTPPNRYLLIVETSRAMKPRAAAVLDNVHNLIESGFGGQLRRGDSIGLWTFNQEIYAGRFPLQRWTRETHQDILLRSLAFLEQQKYEKQSSFDKVLQAMGQVVQNSQFITIILISDGAEKVQGTPFDAQINEYYKLWQYERRNSKAPFITILRARDGQLTDYAMNRPPAREVALSPSPRSSQLMDSNPPAWALQMPPLPAELKVPEHAPVQAPRATQPPATVAPLIFSGRNPRPQETTTTKPEVAKLDPAVAPTPSSASTAAAPPNGELAKPVSAPKEPAKVLEPFVLPDKPAAVASIQPTPTPAAEPKPDGAQAGAEPAKSTVTIQTESTPVNPEVSHSKVEPAIAMPEPAVANLEPKPTKSEPTPIAAIQESTPTKTEPAPAKIEFAAVNPEPAPDKPQIVAPKPEVAVAKPEPAAPKPEATPKPQTSSTPVKTEVAAAKSEPPPSKLASAVKTEPATNPDPAPASSVVKTAPASVPGKEVAKPSVSLSNPSAPDQSAHAANQTQSETPQKETPQKPIAAQPNTPESLSVPGVAVPPPGLLANKSIWIAGFVLIAVAFGIVLKQRRSRTSPHVSLITRSIEHNQK